MHDKIAPSEWVVELAKHNSELLEVINSVLKSMNAKELTSHAIISDALLTKVGELRDNGETKMASALLDVRNKFINPPPAPFIYSPTLGNTLSRRAFIGLAGGAGLLGADALYNAISEPEESPYPKAIHDTADFINGILRIRESEEKYNQSGAKDYLNYLFNNIQQKRPAGITIEEAKKHEMGILTPVLKRAVWDRDGFLISLIAANYPAYTENEVWNYNLMQDVRKYYGETIYPDPNFSKDKLLRILKTPSELARFSSTGPTIQR